MGFKSLQISSLRLKESNLKNIWTPSSEFNKDTEGWRKKRTPNLVCLDFSYHGTRNQDKPGQVSSMGCLADKSVQSGQPVQIQIQIVYSIKYVWTLQFFRYHKFTLKFSIITIEYQRPWTSDILVTMVLAGCFHGWFSMILLLLGVFSWLVLICESFYFSIDFYYDILLHRPWCGYIIPPYIQ